MGRREKTSADKIRNGAGAASSSLSGESAYTHQGAKDGVVGGVGGIDGRAPKMASQGRSGSCRAAGVDWCDKHACGPTLRPQLRLAVCLDGCPAT